jgi:hypothetical protein
MNRQFKQNLLLASKRAEQRDAKKGSQVQGFAFIHMPTSLVEIEPRTGFVRG